jgi:hypothetical protein
MSHSEDIAANAVNENLHGGMNVMIGLRAFPSRIPGN